jgi:hypothetical protein
MHANETNEAVETVEAVMNPAAAMKEHGYVLAEQNPEVPELGIHALLVDADIRFLRRSGQMSVEQEERLRAQLHKIRTPVRIKLRSPRPRRAKGESR